MKLEYQSCIWNIAYIKAISPRLSSITSLDAGGIQGKMPLSSSTSRVNALKTEYEQDSSAATLTGEIEGEERQIHVVDSTLKCSTH